MRGNLDNTKRQGELTMLKLTHDQAERLDALVQEFEEEMPQEDIKDIAIAMLETLKTIVFTEKAEVM